MRLKIPLENFIRENRTDALGETDYTRFHKTADVTDSIPAMRGGEDFNATATAILSSKRDDLALITQALQRRGFRRLSEEIRHGDNALVFEGNDHQMIRVVDTVTESLYERRPGLAIFVQPLVRWNLDGKYEIEVLPKVHTLQQVINDKTGRLAAHYGIPADPSTLQYWEDTGARTLEHELRRCGLQPRLFQQRRFARLKSENIAVMSGADGWPVFLALDPSTAPCANDPPQTSESLAIMAKYEAVQQAHLASLGLKRGEIKGVLDEESLKQELRQFAAQRSGGAEVEKAIYYQALEHEVSPGEFGAAARAAAEEKSVQEGFCQRIRQQLQERHAEVTLKT